MGTISASNFFSIAGPGHRLGLYMMNNCQKRTRYFCYFGHVPCASRTLCGLIEGCSSCSSFFFCSYLLRFLPAEVDSGHQIQICHSKVRLSSLIPGACQIFTLGISCCDTSNLRLIHGPTMFRFICWYYLHRGLCFITNHTATASGVIFNFVKSLPFFRLFLHWSVAYRTPADLEFVFQFHIFAAHTVMQVLRQEYWSSLPISFIQWYIAGAYTVYNHLRVTT